MQETGGNGGESGGWEVAAKVKVEAVVVENDPDKDYVVLRVADGSTFRLSKATDVEIVGRIDSEE